MYCLVLLSALFACVAGVPLINTNPKPNGRLTGGTVTDITSHPYQVSVMNNGTYVCSGSIISANWVVTTAHCVSWSIDLLSVRSGSTNSTSGGTVHDFIRKIAHESYDGSDYNVGLAQVSPAFTFSASVQPITLECNTVPVGTEVVLTGWGMPGSPDGPLEQVTLRTISDSSCRFFEPSITDRIICTADINGGKGACVDWGAPLVASNRLVGIFFAGNSCGDPLPPNMYTKISAVCEWINLNAGL